MELIGNVQVVSLLYPVSSGSAPTIDIFSLEEYNHALIIVGIGATDGTMKVTVEECTAAAGTGNTDIAFNYRISTTTDTWGALTAGVAGTGFTVGATDDDSLYAIEIDADELTDTYEYVKLTFGTPSGSATLMSAIAILSEPRYMKDIPVSAID